MDRIKVDDQGTTLEFSFDDLLRYAGPGSPAGVAVAFQAMRLAFSQLTDTAVLARREVAVETAFRGPGARDGFEVVTRAVTEDRFLVTAALERPERGTTLEQFVFRFRYRGRCCTLLVRPGLVPDEFIAMARKPDRTAQDEEQFTQMKAEQASAVLSLRPEEVFEVE